VVLVVGHVLGTSRIKVPHIFIFFGAEVGSGCVERCLHIGTVLFLLEIGQFLAEGCSSNFSLDGFPSLMSGFTFSYYGSIYIDCYRSIWWWYF